jgi:mannose-6-phosphate isomerase-like protein (cupin superfamily)
MRAMGIKVPDAIHLPTPDDQRAGAAVQAALAKAAGIIRDAILHGKRSLTAPTGETATAVLEVLLAALGASWHAHLSADGKTIHISPRADVPPPPEGRAEVADLTRTLAALGDAYRRVLMTSGQLQLALMTLQPGESIGAEIHRGADQAFIVLDTVGQGVVTMAGVERPFGPGEVALVPAGVEHDVRAGSTVMRLLTIYSPPMHLPGRVHLTRADANADTEDAAYGADQDGGVWLPARYGLGVAVPGGGEGGARCSTCRFAGHGPEGDGRPTCYNKYYVRREPLGEVVDDGRGRTLPAPADAWCCPYWVGVGQDGAVAGDDTR